MTNHSRAYKPERIDFERGFYIEQHGAICVYVPLTKALKDECNRQFALGLLWRCGNGFFPCDLYELSTRPKMERHRLVGVSGQGN